MKKNGFTLIELLVVIAIIAIIAAVVVASLGSARSKGVDAAAKRELATIRTQANLYYTGAGAYTYGTASSSCAATAGTLFAENIIANAITHITPSIPAIACNSTSQTFAVAVTLKQTGAGYYCVDSTNKGKVITTAVATSGLSGAGATYALNTTTGLCN